MLGGFADDRGPALQGQRFAHHSPGREQGLQPGGAQFGRHAPDQLGIPAGNGQGQVQGRARRHRPLQGGIRRLFQSQLFPRLQHRAPEPAAAINHRQPIPLAEAQNPGQIMAFGGLQGQQVGVALPGPPGRWDQQATQFPGHRRVGSIVVGVGVVFIIFIFIFIFVVGSKRAVRIVFDWPVLVDAADQQFLDFNHIIVELAQGVD